MAKVLVSRVDVKSAAAWLTSAFFVLGIFAGIAYTTSFALSGQISGIVILWYLLLTPIFYAVVGLIAAVVICVLYNRLNGTFGGIVLELTDQHIGFELPPLPPNEWTQAGSSGD